MTSWFCCAGRRKNPITSDFDPQFGAPEISAPNEGAYISPANKPVAIYEPTFLQNGYQENKLSKETRFSAGTGGPFGLDPIKVSPRADSTRSGNTAISVSPQLSPAFSVSGTTVVATPRTGGIQHVTLPVHSAYMPGYSSSPPNSGTPFTSTSQLQTDSSTPPPSGKHVSHSSSSTASTPTAPISPPGRVASPPNRVSNPPLRSMTPFGRSASRQGGNRSIPTFVMSSTSPPVSAPTSPPLSNQSVKEREQYPHVVIGEVPRREKNDFMGSPDSEMSVEQWPGSM